MDLGLEKRTVLVSGSHRGTGEATARAFARAGAQVIVHGPQAGGPQEDIARALGDAGLRARAVSGDLTTDAGADEVASALDDAELEVDVLINNLGAPASGRWFDAPSEAWLETYDVNTLSAVRLIQRLVPGMQQRRFGRVIQVATIGTLRPNARMPHYYAAKSALAAITVSLAKEVAGSGVTVNTLSPGLIHTPEVEAWLRHLAAKHGWGESWSEIERRGVDKLMPNPLGRLARVDEVADALLFLASDRASFINGVNLRIDGGASEIVV